MTEALKLFDLLLCVWKYAHTQENSRDEFLRVNLTIFIYKSPVAFLQPLNQIIQISRLKNVNNSCFSKITLSFVYSGKFKNLDCEVKEKQMLGSKLNCVTFFRKIYSSSKKLK